MAMQDWREGLTRLAGPIGHVESVGDLLADEHSRYALYLDALKTADTADQLSIMRLLAGDPDQTMAQSVVVWNIDRMAQQLPSSESFQAWLREIGEELVPFEFAQKRADEWLLAKQIAEGAKVDGNRIVLATDWLQRKLSSETPSRACLETLAESGRTRRIRHGAQERLKRLR